MSNSNDRSSSGSFPPASDARFIPTSSRRSSQMSPLDESGSTSESANSAETVRRVQDLDSHAGTVPSSLESFNTAHEGSTTEHSVHQPARISRQSSRSSLRDRAASPDRKARRPSGPRRASSITHPHKRQGFSAEDEVGEVEEDWEHHRGLAGSTGYAGMRRRSQMLRRRGTQQTILPNVEDTEEEEAMTPTIETEGLTPEVDGEDDAGSGAEHEGTVRAGSYAASEAESVESFTLKDRQEAINETHPFGIRIWKPALYKKDRSVQRTAEGDIHSAPGGTVGTVLFLINILWVLLFGWWLSAATLIGGIVCYLVPFNYSTTQYGRVLLGLAYYILYPFGRYVELKQEEEYAEEDEGEGRSISEYEQWQAGDIEAGRTFFGPHTPRTLVGRRRESLDSVSETDSLLGAGERTGLLSGSTNGPDRKKRRIFGRGKWSFGRVLFYAWFYLVIAPLLLTVSGICWLLVFPIPMAKVTYLLFDHLRRHPLALSFHSDHTYSRRPGTPSTSILLCTYRAVGWKYYKFTVDGTNIFFINLMALVIFVIVDHFALNKALGFENALTSPATIFVLALISVIPLAYFIGQAVASISAQSSMGMGATINAFFSTIVEVYLYCIALSEGKGRLVEGSIVGSIFAGVVFMPGLSMCSGALKRKTQRFNAKSAGVTSTMLLFAVIAAFAPTLFYQIYGTYELSCNACSDSQMAITNTDCRRCYFSQSPPTSADNFFRRAVQPYTYVAAVFLFISYLIGLWFTLRTHAAVIWQAAPVVQAHSSTQQPASGTETARDPTRYQDGSVRGGYDSRTPVSLRDSQLYKRVLGQSLNTVGLRQDGSINAGSREATLHMVPPRSSGNDLNAPLANNPQGGNRKPVHIASLSNEENAHLVRGVAEVAAAAATAAVQDVQRHSAARKAPAPPTAPHAVQAPPRPPLNSMPTVDDDLGAVGDTAGGHGGHDAPNWSRMKSSVILLGATVLYAVVAEILVNTVDVVLENLDIDEKFLGITLFALVPNTTEFLNAISFAMNGNIALSMEIGSAYALQVCLLQIPALVLFSAIYSAQLDPSDLIDHTFSLIFPQWDLVTVILCVFLLSYMYGEGKSNYFKGSILILSYLTVMVGFYLGSFANDAFENINNDILIGPNGKAYFLRHN